MYSEIKAAQMAGYILHLDGSTMAYLKLLKLLYLAERNAISRWGESMSGDNFVSMPHGPVLSFTYDMITGASRLENGWNKYVSGRANYEVSLNIQAPERDTWDELSNAELDILGNTYQMFKNLDKWQLVKYTHDHCPEWSDPNGSSTPISIESIINATCDKAKSQELINLSHEMSNLDQARAIIQ